MSPICLPMIFGVTTISMMTCTTAKTRRARPKTTQKLCPVSRALSPACEGVEIWHEVEDADEDAETYCHWEADDGEADAEEYAHGEGYEALSAHVCVEGISCILCQFLPEMVGGLWEDAYPVL